MSRRPSIPAWMSSWCSSGPKLARLSSSASSRHISDVVRVGGDLVGQDLATGRRLGPLEQETGRERALVLEAGEVDGLDAGQLGDRRHSPSPGIRIIASRCASLARALGSR